MLKATGSEIQLGKNLKKVTFHKRMLKIVCEIEKKTHIIKSTLVPITLQIVLLCTHGHHLL